MLSEASFVLVVFLGGFSHRIQGISTEAETTKIKYSSTTNYRITETSTLTASTTMNQEFQTQTTSSPITKAETTEFKYPSTTDYRKADTSTVTATTKKIQEFQTSTISSPLTTATDATEYTTKVSSTTDGRTTKNEKLTDTTTSNQEFQTQTTTPPTTATFRSTKKETYVTQTTQQQTEATTRTTIKFTEPPPTAKTPSTTLKILSSSSESTPKFTDAISSITFLSTEETRDTSTTRSENVNVSSIVLGLMLAFSLVANLILAILLYKRRQIPGEEDKNKLYTNEIPLSRIEHETAYTDIQCRDDNPGYQYESLSSQNEAIYTNTIP